MSLKEFRPSWQMITASAAVLSVVMGGSGFFAGWKTKVRDEAVMQERWTRHLSETAPLVDQFRDNLVMDARQEARLVVVEQRQAELIAASLRTNDRLDETNKRLEDILQQLIIQNRRRTGGGGQP